MQLRQVCALLQWAPQQGLQQVFLLAQLRSDQ